MNDSYILIGIVVLIIKIILCLVCRAVRSEGGNSSQRRSRSDVPSIFYVGAPAQAQYRPPQIVPAIQAFPSYPATPVRPKNPAVPQVNPSSRNQIVLPVRNPNGNAGGSSVRNPNKKKAELRLMKFEMKLLISYIRLDKVIEIFVAVSRGGYIESENAKEIFRRIAVEDGNRKVNVGGFIDSIKNNGGCNTVHLILSAILISLADEEEKARVLFDLYGDRNSGSINLNSIMVIIACGFRISVGCLPNLIEKRDKLLAIKKYTEKIEQYKDLYSQVLLKMVSEHGESFRKETFIGLFVSKFSFLMKSSSIRILAHSIYKSNKSV